MNGSYVPFSAAHDRFFSVSFVESSRSDRDCHKAAKCPKETLALAFFSKSPTGNRHDWWLKFGWIDRLEGAIWGVSAEIRQISEQGE